jgi:hypothetical protein
VSEAKQGARLVVSPPARDRSAWGGGEESRERERQREDLRVCAMGLRVRPPTIICSRKQKEGGRGAQRLSTAIRCVAALRPAGLGLVLRGRVNGSDAPTTRDFVRWLLSTKSKAINS